MKIAVIGSGGWGTALAIVLHNNGHQVTLWSHTQQESERLDHARENPFLKGVVLPDVIACTSDPACVRGMGMVSHGNAVVCRPADGHAHRAVSEAGDGRRLRDKGHRGGYG